MKHLILEWWQTAIKIPGTGGSVFGFYCHLKSPNGEIVLTSEAYYDPSGVRKLAKALRAAGLNLKMRKRK